MNVRQNQASVGNHRLIPDICHLTVKMSSKTNNLSWMAIDSSARTQSGCLHSDGQLLDAAPYLLQLPTQPRIFFVKSEHFMYSWKSRCLLISSSLCLLNILFSSDLQLEPAR